MRRRWMFGAAAAVLVLGAGVLFLTERPLTVSVVQPEQDVALRIYGLGSVEARILSRVGFEVGAALTGLAVDVGDRVVRGQELATLDPAEQEARTDRARAAVEANVAALARAEATVARARSVLAQRQAANQRQQGLAQRDVISIQRAEEAQRDEDVARADLAVAEADVAVIRAQGADADAALEQEKVLLTRHRLTAPYDAVIITRHAEAGTVVRAGDPIFTLIAPETVWIQAYVDEERAGQLALGQPGTIRLRSQPQAEFQGIIARIGLESDRVNEERRIWLTCTDCPQPMYLGEQAEVRITTGNRDSALMVPEVAITGFDGHSGRVWLVRDGRLQQAELTFGARDDRGRVEVAGNLPADVAIVARMPQGATKGRRARIRTTP